MKTYGCYGILAVPVTCMYIDARFCFCSYPVPIGYAGFEPALSAAINFPGKLPIFQKQWKPGWGTSRGVKQRLAFQVSSHRMGMQRSDLALRPELQTVLEHPDMHDASDAFSSVKRVSRSVERSSCSSLFHACQSLDNVWCCLAWTHVEYNFCRSRCPFFWCLLMLVSLWMISLGMSLVFCPKLKRKKNETLNCIQCIYLRCIFAATDFMVDVLLASRVIHVDRGVS